MLIAAQGCPAGPFQSDFAVSTTDAFFAWAIADQRRTRIMGQQQQKQSNGETSENGERPSPRLANSSHLKQFRNTDRMMTIPSVPNHVLIELYY